MADILVSAIPQLMPQCRAPRWNTRFGRFVHHYGVTALAQQLHVEPAAVYQWVRGFTTPTPYLLLSLITLSRRARRRTAIRLEPADVYAQRILGEERRLATKARRARGKLVN